MRKGMIEFWTYACMNKEDSFVSNGALYNLFFKYKNLKYYVIEIILFSQAFVEWVWVISTRENQTLINFKLIHSDSLIIITKNITI